MLATRSDSAKSKTNSDLAIDFFLIEHCLIGIGIKIGIKIGIGGSGGGGIGGIWSLPLTQRRIKVAMLLRLNKKKIPGVHQAGRESGSISAFESQDKQRFFCLYV